MEGQRGDDALAPFPVVLNQVQEFCGVVFGFSSHGVSRLAIIEHSGATLC
jgi:hypothetical protein